MAGCRFGRRVSGNWGIATLPPGEQQACNDNNQHNLQQQTNHRSEAGHATEKPVSKQEAKQASAKESGGETAEQTTTEQTWAGRRLSDCARFGARLRECTLHRRDGIGRGLSRGRRRESPRAPAPTREATPRSGIRIRGNQYKRRHYRRNRYDNAVSDHRSPPGNGGRRIGMRGAICKGRTRATKSRQFLARRYHGNIIPLAERAGWSAIALP